MEEDSNKAHNDGKSCSRESGIKFVEKKRKRRICRGALTVIMVVCAGMVGGLIGGGCVKSSLSAQASSGQRQGSEQGITSERIHQAMETAGPSVVGILTSSPDESCSGIIFDPAGYIITSYDAIAAKSDIMVVLADKPKDPIEAKLIGADLKTGLAVLKIDVQNLTAAVFDNEMNTRVGDMALSIKNPTGVEYSGAINVGYISTTNNEMDVDDKAYSIIEASALASVGSMGGALCNLNGKVIGICFADGEDTSYALCIDEVKEVAEAIMKGSNASGPYLGIEYTYLDKDTSKAYGKPQGAWISRVRSNSGAERAGFLKEDIVVMANNVAINNDKALAKIISGSSPGESISFKVWRNGSLIDLTAVMGDASI